MILIAALMLSIAAYTQTPNSYKFSQNIIENAEATIISEHPIDNNSYIIVCDYKYDLDILKSSVNLAKLQESDIVLKQNWKVTVNNDERLTMTTKYLVNGESILIVYSWDKNGDKLIGFALDDK